MERRERRVEMEQKFQVETKCLDCSGKKSSSFSSHQAKNILVFFGPIPAPKQLRYLFSLQMREQLNGFSAEIYLCTAARPL